MRMMSWLRRRYFRPSLRASSSPAAPPPTMTIWVFFVRAAPTSDRRPPLPDRVSGDSRCRSGNRVDPPGQRDVLRGETAGVVGGEQDVDLVPDVAPLGMMVGLLGLHRDPRHEAERLAEVAELEAPADRAARRVVGPAGELGQRLVPLHFGQLRHRSSSLKLAASLRAALPVRK